MTNILLLVICFVAGIFLRWTGRFPDNTPAALNGFIIHVSLPALALLHIHRLHFAPTLFFTMSMAWVLFGAGYLFFRQVGRLFRWDTATVGALMLVGGAR